MLTRTTMRETKTRSIKRQTGENAVQMRVHRRSIEQKSNRDKIFHKGRPGLNDSSLDPVLEESDEVAPRLLSVARVKDSRLDMLQRWKEEKKLKAKLKAEKTGKPFKVTKINHLQPIFLFSETQVNGKPITTSAVNANNETMRVTRSKMNAFIQPSTLPEKRAPSARILKSSKPQNAALGPARKVKKTVRGTGKPNASKSQHCETVASSLPLTREAVQEKREPSFAPLQFAFTAPSGLSPFFFQPSKTVEVEKLLSPLIVVSISPVENIYQSSSKDSSNNKEPDNSVSKAEEEPGLKTPHAAGQMIDLIKISPLLENNPRICMTRGRPHSSKKPTPKGNRIREASLATAETKCDVQSTKNEDSTHCFSSMSSLQDNLDSPAKEVVHVENNANRNSFALTLTTSYFRNMLEDHTRELGSLCSTWQAIMEMEQEHMSENVAGKIRTTIGQSELLIAERFKQFSGLIDDCELGRGEKVTTCVDLQGFWEMIFFQVEDVKAKFERLEKMKAASWEEMATPLKKSAAVVKRAVRRGPKPEARSNAGAAVQAARKRLAEAKAKAAQFKKAVKNRSPKNQIFVGGNSSDSLTPILVQDSVPNKQVVSNEIASPGGKNVITRRRLSLRSSLYKIDETPTEDENSISALLLPVPVLESLSINSPLAYGSPRKRLSELFSPLSKGLKGAVRKLETIHDDEDAEMTIYEQKDVPAHNSCNSTATPRKRFTRNSNLMRFSDGFHSSADLAGTEKENANLMLLLN